MARTSKKAPVTHSTWLVATHDEQPVYVVGNTQELGEWNPDKALIMQHCGHSHNAHRWNINLIFPRGQELEFKFIHKAQDGQVAWEAGENRIFQAEDGDTAIEWGGFRNA